MNDFGHHVVESPPSNGGYCFSDFGDHSGSVSQGSNSQSWAEAACCDSQCSESPCSDPECSYDSQGLDEVNGQVPGVTYYEQPAVGQEGDDDERITTESELWAKELFQFQNAAAISLTSFFNYTLPLSRNNISGPIIRDSIDTIRWWESRRNDPDSASKYLRSAVKVCLRPCSSEYKDTYGWLQTETISFLTETLEDKDNRDLLCTYMDSLLKVDTSNEEAEKSRRRGHWFRVNTFMEKVQQDEEVRYFMNEFGSKIAPPEETENEGDQYNITKKEAEMLYRFVERNLSCRDVDDGTNFVHDPYSILPSVLALTSSYLSKQSYV